MSKETEQLLAELERIVAERQDWLFRFAYMRIGIREDAEDVVQEVLLGVFRILRETERLVNVEQYLIKSISNACNDYFRQKPMAVVSIEDAVHIPASDSDKHIHDEFVRINKMLDTLPPEQAEIVRLKCYDDLTFKQVGELLDISEGTAKSRYRYAILHIQKTLRQQSG